MAEQPDRECDQRQRSPADRARMAALTGAGPAGPEWRAGRWPGFTRFAIRGLIVTLVIVLALLLLSA